ncbi:MAG: type II toxin-antitoxin system Phd/YefM family antitoxin [Gemmatimonadales bacterium]
MNATYSLYEAKTKFSAIVRLVREGRSVTITLHGDPVAELRPYQKPDRPETLAERMAELTARGELRPAARQPSDPDVFRLGRKKPGAIRRFLDDRE